MEIGYKKLREMKIKDIQKIEKQYNELRKIGNKGIHKNKEVREKENKPYAEDLLRELKGGLRE